jgi:hypothetical protein
MKKYLGIISIFTLVLIFTACLGLKTEIDIKRNGGGTVNMEYRISNEILAMGTLSGNENSPPIPIGKEDFERTFDRIPGIKMTSYSEKTDGGDRLFLIKSEFDNLEALAGFLDSQGRQLTIERKDGKTILSVGFEIDDEDIDPDFIPILPIIFEDYYMDFKMTLPDNCEVSYLDGNGNALSALPYGETTVSEKGIEFYSSMGELFTEGKSSTVVINW